MSVLVYVYAFSYMIACWPAKRQSAADIEVSVKNRKLHAARNELHTLWRADA